MMVINYFEFISSVGVSSMKNSIFLSLIVFFVVGTTQSVYSQNWINLTRTTIGAYTTVKMALFKNQIWVGTRGGVEIFDTNGVYIKKITRANSPISDNVISSMMTTKNCLWLGTVYGGISYTDGINWKTIVLDSTECYYNNDGSIICQDTSDDGIWFYSYCCTIGRVRHGSTAVYQLPEGSLGGGVSVKTLCFTGKGELWIGLSKGVLVFSENDSSFRKMTEYGFSSTRINSITEDRYGSLWVATYDSGVYKVDKNGIDTRMRKLDSVPYLHFLKNEQNRMWAVNVGGTLVEIDDTVATIQELVDASALNAASSDGMPPVSASEESFYFIADLQIWKWDGKADLKGNLPRDNFPINNGATDFYLDSRNVFWMLDGRASQCNDSGYWKESSGTPPFTDTIEWTYSFNKVVEDPEGNLWFAGYNIWKYDRNNWIKYLLPDSLRQTSCVAKDSRDNIWFGTSLRRGLGRFRNDSIRLFTTFNSIIPSNTITCLCTDASDRIWIGTDSGLVISENGSLTRIICESPSIDKKSVTSIFQDSKEMIWVGFGGIGLVVFDQEKNKTAVHKPLNGGFCGIYVTDIAEDADHILWVATNSGIARFSNAIWDTMTIYNSLLPGCGAQTISIDRHGNTWIGFARDIIAIYNKNGITRVDTTWKDLQNGVRVPMPYKRTVQSFSGIVGLHHPIEIRAFLPNGRLLFSGKIHSPGIGNIDMVVKRLWSQHGKSGAKGICIFEIISEKTRVIKRLLY
ncbi:MAG: hypothetical protein JXA71_05490 [Chitinispirillaceae bacterium]|nr:hypothetical protein [Chitinispirillaceae bacterium]